MKIICPRFHNKTPFHLLLFEKDSNEICEKSVYKHSETIEYVKNKPTF